MLLNAGAVVAAHRAALAEGSEDDGAQGISPPLTMESMDEPREGRIPAFSGELERGEAEGNFRPPRPPRREPAEAAEPSSSAVADASLQDSLQRMPDSRRRPRSRPLCVTAADESPSAAPDLAAVPPHPSAAAILSLSSEQHTTQPQPHLSGASASPPRAQNVAAGAAEHQSSAAARSTAAAEASLPAAASALEATPPEPDAGAGSPLHSPDALRRRRQEFPLLADLIGNTDEWNIVGYMRELQQELESDSRGSDSDGETSDSEAGMSELSDQLSDESSVSSMESEEEGNALENYLAADWPFACVPPSHPIPDAAATIDTSLTINRIQSNLRIP